MFIVDFGKSGIENNEIVISFLDTGKGISMKNLDKVFEPFFTTKDDGIGLGLYLSNHIIKSHNGKIDIKSIIGKGTEVIVRLPMANNNAIPL